MTGCTAAAVHASSLTGDAFLRRSKKLGPNVSANAYLDLDQV